MMIMHVLYKQLCLIYSFKNMKYNIYKMCFFYAYKVVISFQSTLTVNRTETAFHLLLSFCDQK